MANFFKDVKKSRDPPTLPLVLLPNLKTQPQDEDSPNSGNVSLEHSMSIMEVSSSPTTNDTSVNTTRSGKGDELGGAPVNTPTDDDMEDKNVDRFKVDDMLQRNEVVESNNDADKSNIELTQMVQYESRLTQLTQEALISTANLNQAFVQNHESFHAYLKLIDELQNKCNQLVHELNKSNTKLQDKSKELASSNTKLTKNYRVLKLHMERFLEFQAQMNNLNRQNDEYSLKLIEINQDLHEYRGKVKSCKYSVKASSEMIESLKSNIRALNSKMYQKDCKLSSLENTIDNLSGNLSEEKLYVDKLQKKLLDINECLVKQNETCFANIITLQKNLANEFTQLWNAKFLKIGDIVDAISSKLQNVEICHIENIELTKSEFSSLTHQLEECASNISDTLTSSKEELISQNLKIVEAISQQPDLAGLFSNLDITIKHDLNEFQIGNVEKLIEFSNTFDLKLDGAKSLQSYQEEVISKLESKLVEDETIKSELLVEVAKFKEQIQVFEHTDSLIKQEKTLLQQNVKVLEELKLSLQASLEEESKHVIALKLQLENVKKEMELKYCREVESYQRIAASHETENKLLTGQIQLLQVESDEMRVSIGNYKKLISSLKEDNLNHLADIKLKDDTIIGLKEEVSVKVSELRDLSKQFKQKELELIIQMQNLTLLEVFLSEMKDKCEQFEYELEKERSEKNRYVDKVTEMEDNFNSLQSDFQDQKSSYEAKFAAFELEERSLNDLITLYQLQNKKLQSNLIKSQEIAQMLKDKVSEMEMEKKEFKSQVLGLGESKNELRLTLDKLKISNELLEQNNSELNQQIVALQSQLENSNLSLEVSGKENWQGNVYNSTITIKQASNMLKPIALGEIMPPMKVHVSDERKPKEINSQVPKIEKTTNDIKKGKKRPAVTVNAPCDDEIGSALFDIFSATEKSSGLNDKEEMPRSKRIQPTLQIRRFKRPAK